MEHKEMTPLVFVLVASLEAAGADIGRIEGLAGPSTGNPKQAAPEAEVPKDNRIRSGDVHLAQWSNWLNCFNGSWRNC